MRAKQVMSRAVHTVAADASVYDAAQVLLNAGISAAPVVDADDLAVAQDGDALDAMPLHEGCNVGERCRPLRGHDVLRHDVGDTVRVGADVVPCQHNRWSRFSENVEWCGTLSSRSSLQNQR